MCLLSKVWNKNIGTHVSLSFELKLKAKANMLDNVLVLAMLNSQHYRTILKIKKYKWLIRYEMTVH